MVLTRTRSNSLSDVTQLNFWGFDLRDVSIFREMPNIQVVSLSVNQISTLSPFVSCYRLRELHLRENSIADIAELQYLADIPSLRHLVLSENPIASNPGYRDQVIGMLPQLESLDSLPVVRQIQYSRSHPVVQILSKPSSAHPKGNDWHYRQQQALCNAVLALLPALSDESLKLIMDSIAEL
jgi:hypothetical protein